MPTPPTVIQHSTGGPSHGNQTKQRKQGIQIGREEVKLSLFADDMILYIKNPKDSTLKLLEYLNSAKFQDTKLICRNLLHSYTLMMN